MYNEYYCFGGVTLCLTGDAPWQPSDICQPFRIEGGPADHTIRVTVTDALPQPPKNADRQGPTCRWRKEERFCLLQDYGGRYAAFAAREGDTTELRLSEGYRDTLVNAGERILGLPGKVRHDAHHERQVDLLFRAVKLNIVLNLDSRRPVLRQEFL